MTAVEKLSDLEDQTQIAVGRLALLKLVWRSPEIDDWYAYEEILFEALKAHKTQSFTIDKKGIEYNIALLEKLFKGLKVGFSNKGEALRYQPIPNNPDVKGKFRVKKIPQIPFRKQLVHYVITFLRKKMLDHNYAKRYERYYDGEMPASISATWD